MTLFRFVTVLIVALSPALGNAEGAGNSAGTRETAVDKISARRHDYYAKLAAVPEVYARWDGIAIRGQVLLENAD